MDESDPAMLLRLAGKCRRLADALFGSEDSEKLQALAREYEAEARARTVEARVNAGS